MEIVAVRRESRGDAVSETDVRRVCLCCVAEFLEGSVSVLGRGVILRGDGINCDDGPEVCCKICTGGVVLWSEMDD